MPEQNAVPAPIRVVNKHRDEYDVYIGRGSIWGNPFVIGRDGDRDEVVRKYEAHLAKSPELIARLHELRGKRIACFCAPKACHGHVLKRWAESTFHIALTGHRPNKLAGYDLSKPFYGALRQWLCHIIETGLERHPHLTLHSGLALGADTAWSQVILSMREHFPERISFVAEVPVMTQSSRWPAVQDQQFWQHQIDVADQVNVYAEQYSPRAMQLRNEGMIGAAQLVLAVWDGSTGGTGHAVRYAQQRGIQTFHMPPATIDRYAEQLEAGLWPFGPAADQTERPS